MSYFLSEARAQQIEESLPDIWQVVLRILHLPPPDLISAHYGPDSDVPIATVCLRDAADYIQESRYALKQCISSRVLYVEEAEPPNEISANFFGRFFADGAILRLYSCAEHIANCIHFFLPITDDELRRYRGDRYTSMAATIGRFLTNERPNHPITHAVLRLVESDYWQFVCQYRNQWVHDQRPAIRGLGVFYERRRRWEISDEGHAMLGIGTGDQPPLTLDTSVARIQNALTALLEVMTAVYDGLANELLTSTVGLGRFRVRKQENGLDEWELHYGP